MDAKLRLRPRWDGRRFPKPPPPGSDLYHFVVRCPACGGRGFPFHTSRERCPRCFGLGAVPYVDLPEEQRPPVFSQLTLPLEQEAAAPGIKPGALFLLSLRLIVEVVRPGVRSSPAWGASAEVRVVSPGGSGFRVGERLTYHHSVLTRPVAPEEVSPPDAPALRVWARRPAEDS